MLSSMSTITFRRKYIYVMRIKGREQMRIVRISDNFRVHMIVIKIPVQNTKHCAVQYTDSAPAHSNRVGRNIHILIVLDKVIRLTAHYGIRITDQPGPVFLPCKACKQINLAIEKHLIELAKTTVHILIFPACVFGHFPIVFVGVACLDCTLPCSFLKHFVLVIAHTNGVRFGISIN